jgi:hypothetical protein
VSFNSDDTTVITPSSERQEKPLSPESPPTKTEPKSGKVLPPDQFLNGSEDTKKKNLLVKEKKPSSKSSEMPVPKLTEKQNRVVQALKRLGVSPEEVASAPEITPLLKEADGGLKYVLNCFRFSVQNETIKGFLEKYDSIPAGDRERLPWEAIVISAGLDFDMFMGAATFAIANHSSNKSKIIIASSHPKVTKARVRFALLPSGEKDRFAIDTMVGALPSPKGPTFIGKAIFGGAGQAAAGDRDDDEPQEGVVIDDGNLDSLFPPSKDMQEKLIPIRQKLLE